VSDVESLRISGLQRQVCIAFASSIRSAADASLQRVRLLPMAREWKKAMKQIDNMERQRYSPVCLIREY
jgi:hypothetical protein